MQLRGAPTTHCHLKSRPATSTDEKRYGIVIFISNVNSEELSSAELSPQKEDPKRIRTRWDEASGKVPCCYPAIPTLHGLAHEDLPDAPVHLDVTRLRAPVTGVPTAEPSASSLSYSLH